MLGEFKKGFGLIFGGICGAYAGAMLITAAGVWFKKDLGKSKESEENQSEE